jgi:hypothetical protein
MSKKTTELQLTTHRVYHVQIFFVRSLCHQNLFSQKVRFICRPFFLLQISIPGIECTIRCSISICLNRNIIVVHQIFLIVFGTMFSIAQVVGALFT